MSDFIKLAIIVSTLTFGTKANAQDILTVEQAASQGCTGLEPGSKIVKYDLNENFGAIHVESPKGLSRVFVGSAGKLKKKVWEAVVGLTGDPGERTTQQVRFEDLNGDGHLQIVVGTLAESVNLCGSSKLPLLFRKVYDESKGKFRSVLAGRDIKEPSCRIQGSFDPGDGPTVPLVKQIAPTGSSRIFGDKGMAVGLAAPHAMSDGRSETAWSPAFSNGAGEFVTFKINTSDYGVTKIGILSLPKGSKVKKYDRPKTVFLVTDEKVFTLVFPTDPIERPSDLVWFDLPEAESTGCITLVFETSWAPSAKRLLALSELVVLTEADSSEGLSKLVADLGNSKRRRQAAMLLSRASTKAVPLIRRAWPTLDIQGRRAAAQVLSKAKPSDVVDLLTEAAIGDDEVMAKTARPIVLAAGESAVLPLAALMNDESFFERASDLLSELDLDAALEVLADSAGKGSREHRRTIRTRIATHAGRFPGRSAVLWKKIQNSKDVEQILDLLVAAATCEDLRDKVAEMSAQLWSERKDFADRYRLLGIMGRLGCLAKQQIILDAVSDDDHLLRMAALSALAQCDQESVQVFQALKKGLADEEPLVRISALGGIASLGLADKVFEELSLLASEQQEPWPQVRVVVALVANGLKIKHLKPVVEVLAQDSDSQVRLAALSNVENLPADAVEQLIIDRLNDKKEGEEIKIKAAYLTQVHCLEAAVPTLFELLKVGCEPLADPVDISIAVASAKALGAIGGDLSKELLQKARKRSNPATDKAIDAALSSIGKTCTNQNP